MTAGAAADEVVLTSGFVGIPGVIGVIVCKGGRNSTLRLAAAASLAVVNPSIAIASAALAAFSTVGTAGGAAAFCSFSLASISARCCCDRPFLFDACGAVGT